MTDSYLAIAAIAEDEFMGKRVTACATQQAKLGDTTLVVGGPSGTDPQDWTKRNAYLWASSPSWAEKWDYALASHPEEPDYEPGRDSAVITDDDILATVQALTSLPESD